MPQRMTCPHCEAALRIPDDATAAHVICPNCLGRIPNPAAAAPVDDRTVTASLAEDEENRRSKAGVGPLIVIVIFTIGVAFGGGFLMSAFGMRDKEQGLLGLWCLTGIVAGLLTWVMTLMFMADMVQLGEDPHSSALRNNAAGCGLLGVAMVTSVVAALIVVGLTCGAVLGGAKLGGL